MSGTLVLLVLLRASCGDCIGMKLSYEVERRANDAIGESSSRTPAEVALVRPAYGNRTPYS